MRSPATPLAGRLSIRGLVGLLSETVLVVANDTGPLHLAAAVGTSTAGVFWCGNLINGGPFTRARHRPAIGWRLHCPTCGADASRGQDCGHRDSFVGEVSPEEVIGNALDLFRGSDARRAGMRSIAS
jgi:ADP-heptose:LPS heptosyltransferase